MIDDSLISDFVAEGREMLDEVEPKLIELQQMFEATGEMDMDVIGTIFRLFHSMKGSAGFLGLNNVSSVTHEAETLLDLFRKGKATMKQEHTDLFCRSLDYTHMLMTHIDENRTDAGFENETGALVKELKAAIAAEQSGGAKPVSPSAKPEAPAVASQPSPAPVSKSATMAMDVPPEMRERFIQETDELLDRAEECLLRLSEGSSEDISEPITEAFRALHSIKGNCGFMGLADLERMSHKTETVLSIVRDGIIPCDESNVGMLLKIIDIIREAVVELSGGGKGEVPACDVYLELLTDMMPQEMREAEKAVAKPAMPTPAAVSAPVPSQPEPISLEPESSVSASVEKGSGPVVYVIDDNGSLLDVVSYALEQDSFRPMVFSGAKKALAEIETAKGDDIPIMVITDIMMPEMDGTEFVKELHVKHPSMPVLVMTAFGNKEMLMKLVELGIDDYIEKPFEIPAIRQKIKSIVSKVKAKEKEAVKKSADMAAGGGTKKGAIARRDIRVDLDKLDKLINLVGELVIAEAMVTRNPDLEGLELENFERAGHHLHRITTDLQDIAMAVRMIPLSATFRKMIRLVHDVANKSGKKSSLELIGEETEVDKTVIEMIADPLVHIVRNSIDHGLEPPEERIRIGKPETGVVTIEGRHEGGEVWILISDDGRGLNKEKILSRAIERGLIAGDGSELSDEEIYAMIFEPGFSTAEKVTDVSGRGVGMDVVKKNIEKLKGRVDIRSRPGKGSTVILRIPLTLAIIEGMLVRVGTSRYTIPMLSIRETLRVETETVTETMDGQEVVNIRNELVPVVRLHEVFGTDYDSEKLEDGILLVIEDGRETIGLFVDEILGQEQTVIKGLSNFLGHARGISGCTILGDGEVSLIIDVASVLDMCKDLVQK
ncbi:MAG: chemotaxis protein CheA [Planctomycetes bacterium]|nr:chemotaxis protein CheA [Planctomycetota bacterium]